jgi:hypothetical protein
MLAHTTYSMGSLQKSKENPHVLKNLQCGTGSVAELLPSVLKALDEILRTEEKKKKTEPNLGMVMHACDPSTQETEAGGSLIGDQPWHLS